jgi:hypothetical protein
LIWSGVIDNICVNIACTIHKISDCSVLALASIFYVLFEQDPVRNQVAEPAVESAAVAVAVVLAVEV